MTKSSVFLLFFLLLEDTSIMAQKSTEYLPEKPGKVILNQYSMNVTDELHRNVKQVAEYHG